MRMFLVYRRGLWWWRAAGGGVERRASGGRWRGWPAARPDGCLALVARDNAVGAGSAFVCANVGLAGIQAGCFGAGEFARAHASANAGLLVALAGV